MTKVMINVPDNLHRLIKTVTSSKGETMKHFILRAMEHSVKQETKSDANNSAQDLITEEEADNLLKPYLSSLAADIQSNSKKTVNSK